ncbi:cell cycle checkpoint control protein RAD9A [Aedes albopictus]|uniref:DNA repair protein rad9 n=1 Tax=Aedes albopictus TaxID=7160 RepID=A0ABM1YHB8_AEDAL|nr:cell cycle checkpoint control protein RAD9A [Aedes albopictus]
MNCIITGRNMKILARTVNFFSKIGTELYLEALPTGLSLKALNSINTAYVVTNFGLKYFISFRQGANDRFEENNCKVSIKPMLKIFKRLGTIQICKIWIQVNRKKIVFQFQCKSDILKTHIIPLLEHEHINSLRLPESFANKVVGDHKVFNKVLMHFHRNVKEVTFDVKSDETVVSNYIENTSRDRTTMRSSLSIESTAFKLYDLESPSSITFCYKEFKAMANYAEQNHMTVEMNFDQAGGPLMIRMKKDDVLQIRFIMGTMRPRLEKQNRSVQRANRKLDDQLGQNKATPTRKADSERIDTCRTSITQDSDRTQMPDSESRNSCLRGDDTRHDSELAPVALQQTPQARRSEVPSRMTSDKPNRETFLDGLNTLSTSSSVAFGLHPPAVPLPNNPPLRTEDDPESYDIVFAGNSNDPNSESQQGVQIPASSKRRVDSQGKPNAKRPNLSQLRSEALFTGAAAGAAQPLAASTSSRLAINIPESVPESPEVIAERKRKEERMRHVFRKCFEDTFDPRKVGTSTAVFAENSDPEDN